MKFLSMVAKLMFVAMLMARSGMGYAITVNIDFNAFDVFSGTSSPTYDGLGAAPDLPANTFWNGTAGISRPEASNLRASDGSATTVGIATWGLPTDTGASSAASDLLRDYVYGPGSFLVLPDSKISGLKINQLYDLYFYAVAGDSSPSVYSVFKVNGVEQGTTGGRVETTELTLGEDYVVFRGIQASDTGEIDFNWSGPGLAPFNGMQIQEVPLPNALVLFLWGLLPIIRKSGIK